MVLLTLLALVYAVGIPITVIVLLVRVSALNVRISSLEAQGAGGRVQAVQPAEPPPVPEKAPALQAATEPTNAAPASPAPVVEKEATPAPVTTAPPVPATGRAHRFAGWLKANWIYVVSAASLALAGIFLVQYGIERGLLPPAARVAAALLFGAALVAAGEWFRRQQGPVRDAAAVLPSVFAGAGCVSMFAGVVAARQLYDLIDVGPALVGLVAVAGLSILLGWFYGSFLAGVGLIGAAVAPLIVGGDSQTVDWLYAYYALIGATGLGIDTMRRWAWVSVLAMGLAYLGMGLIALGSGSNAGLMVAVVVMALFATVIPCRALAPDHQGATLASFIKGSSASGFPAFPTWLAGGAVLAGTATLLLIQTRTPAESGLAFGFLALAFVGLTLWSRGAPALSDLAALPLAAFLLRLVSEAVQLRPLAQGYFARAIPLREPESAGPQTAAILLLLALAMTLAASWRSAHSPFRLPFAAAAVLAAPLCAALLEFYWHPGLVVGTYPWALQVISLAAVMVLLATRFARQDGEDRTRVAFAALAVLSLIALALFLILTQAALTMAFAVLVVVAADLDRRFRLPQMGLFQIAAIAAIGWRQMIDPGADWAVHQAALWEVFGTFVGAAVAMFAARRLIRGLDRPIAAGTIESAGFADLALLANVLLQRGFENAFPDLDLAITHWAVTLQAMPWLVFALVQLYRLGLGGPLRGARIALAVAGGVLALGGLMLAATLANPLFDSRELRVEYLVVGPVLANSLLVAYALPAAVIWSAVRWGIPHLHPSVARAMRAVAVGLATLWAGLAIRHFWWGPYLALPEVKQGELYSYTIAMMLVGGALIYQAMATRSASLRRGGMSVIALTIAKVFLIDVTGLTGLTRVFSFLLLGLALAGLAWLNRWAAQRQQSDTT